MRESATLRIGIIGAGGIAQHYHIPSYRRCEQVEVVAACDIHQAALEQMRTQFGVTSLYTDYREMLDKEQLDVVSVCASNDQHYPIVVAAIDKGLDIYCEKPLAMTYEQAKRMYASALSAGIKTGVNFSHRRTPAAMLAKEILDSGALGAVNYVSAVYAAGWVGYADRPATWRNDRDRAGFGGLGDMGSHMIDMMLWWLGCDITSVAAQMQTVVPRRESAVPGRMEKVTTEDHGTLLLSYSNGALGYLCGSYVFTGRGYDQRVEVYGTRGGLMYNQQRPHELDIYLDPETLGRYVVLRQGGTPDTPYSTIQVPERLAGIQGGDIRRRTLLMDWVDAYRSDAPFAFRPGFEEGMRVQEVLEATRRAEVARCWISLPL